MQLTANNPVVACAAQKPVSSFPSLSGRIPELDGLRGLAIGMILVYHYFLISIQASPATPLAYLLATGRLAWSGVDLFFVLSGFLIGGILLDARQSSNYFHVFYTRRFFRIIPIYFFCLLAAFLLYSLSDPGTGGNLAWMQRDRLPWIPYTLFLQNFWMASGSTLGAFGLSVTWSLAVEEQFYLTLPTVIRFLNTRRLVSVLLAGTLLAPLLRISIHAVLPDHPVSWVVLMPCRADALLLGVLGAVALRDARCLRYLARSKSLLRFGLAMLASGFVFLTLHSPDPYGFGMLTLGFSWLALFYLTILLYALLFREGWLSKFFRWKWLRWLGSIAYGTYLFHELVRGAFFGLLGPRPPQIHSVGDLLLSVLALAVTLVICQLSWIYFEKPLVQIGHRAGYELDEINGSEAVPTLRVEGAISK